MKKYIPLFLVESYLLFTLFVFFFGPIDFHVHNFEVFLVLIVLYHLSFILGYLISTSSYKFKHQYYDSKLASSSFFIMLAFALVAALVTYKNVMMTDSFIPYDFFDQIIKGIESPAEVYVERRELLESGGHVSSRFFNVISIFFMFFKFLFIFYSVYHWRDYSFMKKFIFVLFCFVFISPSLAGGINSILFYFVIFMVVSLFFVKLMRSEINFTLLTVVLTCALLLLVGFFGYIMSFRGGSFEYFNGLSPLGDISIAMSTPDFDSILGFYTYSFVWISSYVVQGYYGFSLALSEEWIWTYGFGSSHFLQNQLSTVFGVDVNSSTFQYRISHIWDEKAMWHSFYAQIANDFGFVGVALVMFGLGFLLSRIWSTIVFERSFYGAAMMPILVLLFIFMPANNQIFGFIDTISYFFAILILWFLEDKRVKVL